MTPLGATDGPRPLYLPPFRVDLEIRAGAPRLLSAAALARALRSALVAGGAPGPASVGLILANDPELARLNATHFGEPGPTDVLSFPLLPPDAYPPHPGTPPDERPVAAGRRPFVLPPGSRIHLGDIVVSVERAVEQAAEGRGGQTGTVRWDPADELRLLVVHGALHLCGWDHAEPGEAAAMEALTRRILAAG